jgi:uncharacterized protein with PQ loop repeat
MNIDGLEELIGWIGAFFTVCFYLYLIYPCVKTIREKSFFEENLVIDLSTYQINSFLWHIYGDMIFCDQIKISNMIGSVISYILMIIVFMNQVKKYVFSSIKNVVIIIFCSWGIYNSFNHKIEDEYLSGKFCLYFSIVFYLNPVCVIFNVILNEDTDMIQIYKVIIYFLSSIFWLAYGIIIWDYYLKVLNSIGAIISFMHILLYIIYKKKVQEVNQTKKKEKKRSIK